MKYFVQGCSLLTTKNNRPYGACTIVSESRDKIQVNIWELQENLTNKEIETTVGMVPDAKGYISFSKSAISIIQDAGKEWSDLLPVKPSKTSFCNLFMTLSGYYEVLDSKHKDMSKEEVEELKKMLIKVVEDVYDKYILWPAASNNHHAYKGGLAQHTYEVMRVLFYLKKEMLSAKPSVDMISTAWAALLHDYGKLFDYGEDMKPTQDMYLIYHTVSSFRAAPEVIKPVVDAGLLNESQIKHIEHMILAHHGKKEWGSPVVPCTYEAFMVSMADMISGHGWEFVHTDDFTRSYALDRTIINTIK